MTIQKQFKTRDEEFVLEAEDDGGSATLTDERGYQVKIVYSYGKLGVVHNGMIWPQNSMEEAIERPVGFCFQVRAYQTEEAGLKEIVEYIEGN